MIYECICLNILFQIAFTLKNWNDKQNQISLPFNISFLKYLQSDRKWICISYRRKNLMKTVLNAKSTKMNMIIDCWLECNDMIHKTFAFFAIYEILKNIWLYS